MKRVQIFQSNGFEDYCRIYSNVLSIGINSTISQHIADFLCTGYFMYILTCSLQLSYELDIYMDFF